MRRGIQTIVGGVIGLTWWSAIILGSLTWTRLIGEPGVERALDIRPNGPWTYRLSVPEIIAVYLLTVGVALLVVVLVAFTISKLFRFPQLDLWKLLRGLLLTYAAFVIASWSVNTTNWAFMALLSYGFLGLAWWWSDTALLPTK